MARSLIVLAAVLLSSQLHAASISKCVDAAGKVTFTQNRNCPAGTTASGSVNAYNPTPGSGEPVKLADPDRYPAPATTRAGQAYTVVGAPVAPPPAPVVPQADPVRPVVARPANQPCVKVVEQNYSYSRIDKKGQRHGVGGIRKVVVPC